MSEKKKAEAKASGKKRGLGRGLSALIGTDPVENILETTEKDEPQKETRDQAVVELDIRQIEPDAAQPRKSFGDEAMEELAASIRQ